MNDRRGSTLSLAVVGGLFALLLSRGVASGQAVGLVEADVSVREDAPATNFGASPLLVADSTPGRQAMTFLRVRVSGVGGLRVTAAALRLQVATPAGAGSDSGGALHAAPCGWDELALTWQSRPAVDAQVLARVGPVAHKAIAAFDLGDTIGGDGVYCFALVSESPSGDDVTYIGREGKLSAPELRITTALATTTTVVTSSTSTSSSSSTSSTSSTMTTTSTTSTSFSTTTTPTTATTVLAGSTTTTTVPPCLSGDGPLVTLTGTLSGAYNSQSLAAGTRIDARAATFLASPTNLYPISLGGAGGCCLLGGTVLGQYDRTWTWSQMHGINNAGIAFLNGDFTIDGLRVDDVEDGIRPRQGGGFTVRNAWLSYVRDDCVENDHLQDGLIDDSLLDGCYVAFSARPSPSIISSGYDGRNKLWTIRNTLVRLEPMPGPDGPTPDGLGHGGFFKWHLWGDPVNSLSPKLALHDNVFLAERVGVVGADRMGIPPGELLECSNNVMVWLGPGDFPAPLPAECFTVTTDRAVWDNAVADWVARHLSRLDGTKTQP